MAKLICRKKACSSTHFKKVTINEFHDYSGSLFNNLPEVDIDNDIKGYECIACHTITFPTLDYTNPESDRKLLADLLLIVDGKGDQIEPKFPKSKRLPHGTARVVEKETYDPSQHGKFVRK